MRSKEQKLYDAGLDAQTGGRFTVAAEKYKSCLKIVPNSLPVLNNYGYCLMALQKYGAALKVLEKADKIQPDNVTILGNLATCYRQVGDLEAACQSLENRNNLHSDIASLRALTATYRVAGRLDEAFAVANKIAGQAGYSVSDQSNLLHLARELCEWRVLDTLAENQICEKLAADTGYAGSPFRYYSHLQDPERLKIIARRAAQAINAPSVTPPAATYPLPSQKLRIGFISQDFRDHPTMKLVCGLLCSGEAQGIEIFIYAIGPDSDDPRRRELEAKSTVFRHLGAASASKSAEKIRNDKLHALIDLMGYTRNAVPEILSHRPCALQIAWLVFPGTTGAPWIDYIIADNVVIPDDLEDGYDEKILRLDPTFFSFDNRTIRARAKSRKQDHGLPESGFIFASFNQSFKFDPVRFHSWCEALNRTPGSVLWLLEASETTKRNLKREAGEKGVEPDRIIFAPRVPHDDHYQRIGLADLMLDTWLYGGHTTTIDALWAGVPVVTRIGPTFTSRVAASILGAAQLHHLVAHSEAEYLELAVKIANHESCLAELVGHVKNLSPDGPPFGTEQFSRKFFEQIRGVACRKPRSKS